jgi:hypothetical protein
MPVDDILRPAGPGSTYSKAEAAPEMTFAETLRANQSHGLQLGISFFAGAGAAGVRAVSNFGGARRDC